MVYWCKGITKNIYTVIETQSFINKNNRMKSSGTLHDLVYRETLVRYYSNELSHTVLSKDRRELER